MEFLYWKIITDTVVCDCSLHYWLIFVVILKMFFLFFFFWMVSSQGGVRMNNDVMLWFIT